MFDKTKISLQLIIKSSSYFQCFYLWLLFNIQNRQKKKWNIFDEA